MKRFIAMVLLVALAAPGLAHASTPPALSLDQRMKLRCSAAFAMVADRQARGEEWALAYPSLAESGREFFVRASAQVMEEAGLNRETVAAALTAEAQELVEADTLRNIVPVCLTLLPDD